MIYTLFRLFGWETVYGVSVFGLTAEKQLAYGSCRIVAYPWLCTRNIEEFQADINKLHGSSQIILSIYKL
jgi:hypothetical protein